MNLYNNNIEAIPSLRNLLLVLDIFYALDVV